ncbi:ribonuclease H-like domain-containing protein [Spirochaetota bacterium]
MIDGCFTHFDGIGLKTESKLRNLGFNSWEDCLSRQQELPFSATRRNYFIDSIKECRFHHKKKDISYFVSKYPPREHWRILAAYYDRATYFDIETTGLSWYYSNISVITAFRKGKVYKFLHGENLEDFLELIEKSEMLVSFNGNCFDIPFIERAFNIPEICCPHVDLRWVSYYLGYRGGLKAIEKAINIERPNSIKDIDGYEAVNLYYKWEEGDGEARDLLVKYCIADTLSTYILTIRLLNKAGICAGDLTHDELFKMAMDDKGF